MQRRPDPPPLPTDDVRTVAIGTGAWTIVLLVLLALWPWLRDTGRTWWIATCVCGVALGLVGLHYCRRRARAIARDLAREISD